MSRVAPHPPPKRRIAGMSIIEVTFATAVLTLVVGGVTQSFISMQDAFDEQVAEAELQLKSRAAMNRLVRLASTALTTDAAYSMVDSTSKTITTQEYDSSYNLVETTKVVDTAPTLRFRELQGTMAGTAVYDDNAVYHLLGPGGTTACDGVVIARGPDLASVEFWSAGQDGKLGTKDDDTSIEFKSGTPAVETLLTDHFAPENGQMLEFATLPGSNGRMLIITLRSNVQRPDGTYLLSSDLVLQERVALRW